MSLKNHWRRRHEAVYQRPASVGSERWVNNPFDALDKAGLDMRKTHWYLKTWFVAVDGIECRETYEPPMGTPACIVASNLSLSPGEQWAAREWVDEEDDLLQDKLTCERCRTLYLDP